MKYYYFSYFTRKQQPQHKNYVILGLENSCIRKDQSTVQLIFFDSEKLIQKDMITKINNQYRKEMQRNQNIILSSTLLMLISLAIAERCGDGRKGISEQCDNRNQTGCFNCVISKGYVCQEDENLLSICGFKKIQHVGYFQSLTMEKEYQLYLLAGDLINIQIQIDFSLSINFQIISPGKILLLQTTSQAWVFHRKILSFTASEKGQFILRMVKDVEQFEGNYKVQVLLLKGCGDGVRNGYEQCDNRNQHGCMNCFISAGYTCTQDTKLLSSCTTTCGDGIKADTEQCDNRNQTGCINCTKSFGYDCNQNNQLSICATVCGDGIRAGLEQCDNQNRSGCINCLISAGYVCRYPYKIHSVCGINVLQVSDLFNSRPQFKEYQFYLFQGDLAVIFVDFNSSSESQISIQIENPRHQFEIYSESNKAMEKQYYNIHQYTAFQSGLFKLQVQMVIGQNISYKIQVLLLKGCGDGTRNGKQQCDNRSQTGCLNCVVQSGYICTGSQGQESSCSSVCGDSIKTENQDCDNGRRVGCRICKIELGYKCVLLGNGKTSYCFKG